MPNIFSFGAYVPDSSTGNTLTTYHTKAPTEDDAGIVGENWLIPNIVFINKITDANNLQNTGWTSSGTSPSFSNAMVTLTSDGSSKTTSISKVFGKAVAKNKYGVVVDIKTESDVESIGVVLYNGSEKFGEVFERDQTNGQNLTVSLVAEATNNNDLKFELQVNYYSTALATDRTNKFLNLHFFDLTNDMSSKQANLEFSAEELKSYVKEHSLPILEQKYELSNFKWLCTSTKDNKYLWQNYNYQPVGVYEYSENGTENGKLDTQNWIYADGSVIAKTDLDPENKIFSMPVIEAKEYKMTLNYTAQSLSTYYSILQSGTGGLIQGRDNSVFILLQYITSINGRTSYYSKEGFHFSAQGSLLRHIQFGLGYTTACDYAYIIPESSGYFVLEQNYNTNIGGNQYSPYSYFIPYNSSTTYTKSNNALPRPHSAYCQYGGYGIRDGVRFVYAHESMWTSFNRSWSISTQEITSPTTWSTKTIDISGNGVTNAYSQNTCPTISYKYGFCPIYTSQWDNTYNNNKPVVGLVQMADNFTTLTPVVIMSQETTQSNFNILSSMGLDHVNHGGSVPTDKNGNSLFINPYEYGNSNNTSCLGLSVGVINSKGFAKFTEFRNFSTTNNVTNLFYYNFIGYIPSYRMQDNSVAWKFGYVNSYDGNSPPRISSLSTDNYDGYYKDFVFTISGIASSASVYNSISSSNVNNTYSNTLPLSFLRADTTTNQNESLYNPMGIIPLDKNKSIIKINDKIYVGELDSYNQPLELLDIQPYSKTYLPPVYLNGYYTTTANYIAFRTELLSRYVACHVGYEYGSAYFERNNYILTKSNRTISAIHYQPSPTYVYAWYQDDKNKWIKFKGGEE